MFTGTAVPSGWFSVPDPTEGSVPAGWWLAGVLAAAGLAGGAVLRRRMVGVRR